MRKLLSVCLMMMLLCTAFGTAGAADEILENVIWDDYCASEDILDNDLLTFLGQAKADDGETVIVDAYFDEIYKAMPANVSANSVFAMTFKALDAPPYGTGSYFADFALETTEPVWVYLLGQYQSFAPGLTVPIGPIKLEPGEDYKVLANTLFAVDYNFVWSVVGEFQCGAILITDEFLQAAEAHGGLKDFNLPKDVNLLDLDSIVQAIADGKYAAPLAAPLQSAATDTQLTLSLKLYERADSVDGYVVNDPITFTYIKPEQEIIGTDEYVGQSEPIEFHLTDVVYNEEKAAAYLYKLPDTINWYAKFEANNLQQRNWIEFQSGSITVKLQPEYLRQLPKGDYMLVVDDDKTDNVTYEGSQFTIVNDPAEYASPAPKTGDSANLTLWFALCAASLLSLLALRRKMPAR